VFGKYEIIHTISDMVKIKKSRKKEKGESGIHSGKQYVTED